MRRFYACILAVFLMLFIIGCSNDTKQKAGGTNNFMNEIKQRGKVIVATEAAFAPFEFVEDGKIVGYGSDILQEIIKSMGVKLEQVDTAYAGILTGLEAKKYDFVATSITITPERQEKFGFTTPIADASLVFIKRKGDESIKTKEDMNGKTIGCQITTTIEKRLITYNETLKASGKEGFKELLIFQTYPDAHLDLKNGRIDLIPQMMPTANYLLKQEPDTYEIVYFEDADEILGGKRYLGWAVRKEDTELLNFLNEEILKMKKSGKLAELQEKWFGTTWDLPDELPK